MKILIASDSFKNSLTSIEVANNLELGLIKNKQISVQKQIISDGGEGALAVFLHNKLFSKIQIEISDSLGRSINAEYAINLTDKVAFIEMAQSSGLELLNDNEKNPFITSTYGVGEMVLDAYNSGVRKFILSVGGSATNDGGAGVLSALGVKFIGLENKFICNSDLHSISGIDLSKVLIENCSFKILADVDNPLLGDNGATYTYAIQKGASISNLPILEINMHRYADALENTTGLRLREVAGIGAAGGIAFGLANVFDVEIVSGVDYFMKIVNLDEQISESDLVISGEGSIDEQTLKGKLISGIAKKCKQHNKSFILVGGKVDYNIVDEFYELGCVSVFSIQDKPQSLNESVKRTAELLQNTGRNIAELMKLK
ncbi:MAG: glycerate kinase [Ichthyobacteriaceae bacterium]|nr:glycerate kinase [Ichthyobacteriaceae bacterium]